MQIYYPSCNFTAASPEAAKKIRAYLSERMPVAGCCRFDQKYDGEEAVYFCQACRQTLEARAEQNGRTLQSENLIVYLTKDQLFPWPDYSGLTVNVQDCWRDREHPEIFDAVRLALQKMHIEVHEIDEIREKSRFCGNLHFEPSKPENIRLMQQYDGLPIEKMPPEVEKALMREQVEKYTEKLTVAYCNRCLRGIRTGGGKGVHLLELAVGTYNG